MAKDLAPFADLTIPGAGWDILGSATRKSAAKTNIFEGKLRFNAVIIKTLVRWPLPPKKQLHAQVNHKTAPIPPKLVYMDIG